MLLEPFKISDFEWPERLRAVAGLVRPDAKAVADIGYDHGKLLVQLLQSRPYLRAIGVEVSDAFGRRLRERLVSSSGRINQRLELRMGDGLSVLKPGDVDTVVLAGLGERKIVSLVAASPDVASRVKRLIVCPANLKGHVRAGLRQLGWTLVDEVIAWEKERFYRVLAYERGASSSLAPEDELLGQTFRSQSPERAICYLRWLASQVRPALNAYAKDPASTDPFLQYVGLIEPMIADLERQCQLGA